MNSPSEADLDALRALAEGVMVLGPHLVAADVPLGQIVTLLNLPNVSMLDASGRSSIA